MNADPADPGKEPSKKGGLARREIRTCATCGTKFSVTSDSGMCPVCVLLGSFGQESASADSLIAASESEGGSAETEHLSIVLGLAKTLDESTSGAGISSPGAFVGTLEFASPEPDGGLVFAYFIVVPRRRGVARRVRAA